MNPNSNSSSAGASGMIPLVHSSDGLDKLILEAQEEQLKEQSSSSQSQIKTPGEKTLVISEPPSVVGQTDAFTSPNSLPEERPLTESPRGGSNGFSEKFTQPAPTIPTDTSGSIGEIPVQQTSIEAQTNPLDNSASMRGIGNITSPQLPTEAPVIPAQDLGLNLDNMGNANNSPVINSDKVSPESTSTAGELSSQMMGEAAFPQSNSDANLDVDEKFSNLMTSLKEYVRAETEKAVKEKVPPA